MATLGITLAVVDGDVVEGQAVSQDTETLNGGVLDVQTADGRVVQVVGVEELGLLLSAVGSLAVPPAGTATVDDMAGSAGDVNVASGEADEGASPLLVSERGFALEDDLHSSG